MYNQVRRTKLTVPETQKDEKYWEKRKKNNLAAKKSRDNRRSFEDAIRNKVQALEKVNMLLTKELTIIKSTFGIPEGRSVLTVEDQEEMANALEQANLNTKKALSSNFQLRPVYTPRYPSESELDTSSPASPSYVNARQSSYVDNHDDINANEHEHHYYNHMSTSSVARQSEKDRNSHVGYNHSDHGSTFSISPSRSPDSCNYDEPTDLSMKRKMRYDHETHVIDITDDNEKGCADKDNSDNDDNSLYIQEIRDSEQDTYIEEAASRRKRFKMCKESDDAVLNKIFSYEANESLPENGEDLKSKLAALSKQVHSMYKLVYKDD